MADEKDALAMGVAVATEWAKDSYRDLAHPTMAATGQIFGLIPQAINAALMPIHQWVAKAYYKLDETKKILAEKLKDVPPNEIVSPEPHIAVPALQAISYSMDNEEIRNMYANLLASSMTKKVKGDVHPAFIEIIKQLSPDEARILSFLYKGNDPQPIITLRLVNSDNKYWCDFVKNFTNLHRSVPNLEYKDHKKVSILLDNLSRQKIIEIHERSFLTAPNIYDTLESDPVIQSQIKLMTLPNHQWKIERMGFELTSFGKSFCRVCIADPTEPKEVQ
jgi:hypothetical protein